MDGDLGGGFFDVDGGFPLDLRDFGLWLSYYVLSFRLLNGEQTMVCIHAILV